MKTTPEIDKKIEEYKKFYPEFTFKHWEYEGDPNYGWKVSADGGKSFSFVSAVDEEDAEHIKETCGIDALGELYFTIDNPYESGKSRLRMFMSRPGDALQAIKDGYGHVLSLSRMIFSNNKNAKVLFFFNKELGEKLRQATIEGFKDAQFKYVVDLNLTAGYGATYRLGPNGEAQHTTWGADKTPVFFETEEEAQAEIDALEKRIKDKVDSFKTMDDYSKWLEEEFTKEGFTVFTHAVAHEAELKLCRAEDDKRETAYYFEINQEMMRG